MAVRITRRCYMTYASLRYSSVEHQLQIVSSRDSQDCLMGIACMRCLICTLSSSVVLYTSWILRSPQAATHFVVRDFLGYMSGCHLKVLTFCFACHVEWGGVLGASRVLSCEPDVAIGKATWPTTGAVAAACARGCPAVGALHLLYYVIPRALLLHAE